MARGIGILYKSRSYFSLETMRMLYNAFLYPYFTYCIEVFFLFFFCFFFGGYLPIWFGTTTLVKLQKRPIRTIAGAREYEHTLRLFHNLKLLNIKEVYIYCVQSLMFNYHQDPSPSVLSDFYLQIQIQILQTSRSMNIIHDRKICSICF